MQPFETPTIELTGERFILLAHEIFGYHVGYEEMFVVNLPRAAMGLGRPKEENITFGCVSEDVPDNIFMLVIHLRRQRKAKALPSALRHLPST